MITNQEKPEELIRVEKLIDDAKVHEAHELLNNFERKEGLPLQDKVSSQLLRADLLFQQGRYREALTLAEQTSKESLELGKILQSVDCYFFMAYSLVRLGKLDEALDLVVQGEELLKNLTQVLSSKRMKREACIALIKGYFYEHKVELDLGLKYFKQSVELGEKTDLKKLNALALRSIAYIYGSKKGEMDLALDYIKKGVAVAKESKNKFTIAQCLNNLAILFTITGEWDRALKIYEECLVTYEKLGNKQRISTVFANMAGVYEAFTDNINQAAKYIEKSLATFTEDGLFGANRLLRAIIIDLKKGDSEQAKKNFKHLEQVNSKVKEKEVEICYRLGKALILKNQLRFRSMGKAEKILKELIGEGVFLIDLTRTALVNLCDILLYEYRVTSNLEILNELEPLVTHLLSIADKIQSHRLQAETYLFQAKLALLSFDVKKSRRFLTQAQQIAERHNLNKIALEISSEHNNLIDRLELWEQLKNSKAPISERFELAQMSEQMERMQRSLVIVKTQIIEDKVAIHKERKICLVCRSEVLRFSYICECGAIYCDNCARAVTDLENVCWVCDVPIDYSKPVKQFKEEIEKNAVKKKVKKDNNK
ncbi:MAG: tetratricopeptide repeat protein [Candidatus Lokiarchaeota archaeon]|nr:tetratricopeptide repeat protein [Candidatus Lokiarchaeota archaeon]